MHKEESLTPAEQELESVLDKYLAMKWIDESIKDPALKSAETINIAKSPDPQYDDHIGVSYLFIQKLNGKYINEEMLPPFEKEIVEPGEIDVLKDDSRSVISIQPETFTGTGKRNIKIVQRGDYPKSGGGGPEDPTDRSIKEIDKGLELLSEKNKEFETVEIYVCTICGNIEFAPLPDICPVCDHDKKFFKKISFRFIQHCIVSERKTAFDIEVLV